MFDEKITTPLSKNKRLVSKSSAKSLGLNPKKSGGNKMKATKADMTKKEAIDCIDEFKKNTGENMKICYDLFIRKGYLALGYESFKECVAVELTDIVKYDYALKLKNAGEVHVVVAPNLPMGTFSEGVLRPLHKYPDEVKKEIWGIATEENEDIEDITGNTLIEIIEDEGFSTAPESKKKGQATEIKISSKLRSRIRSETLEAIKELSIKAGSNPVSKKYFDQALKIIFDDVRAYISGKYEKLYPE